MNPSRAMIFTGPGQPLRLQSFDRPPLGPGEALVEVLCCTLCGSDVHTFLGRRTTPCPTVLGHEVVGRLVELPREGLRDHTGQPLGIGDRVVWSVMASCGACFFCGRGLPQKCERLFKYGHEPLSAGPMSGGLAEHCLLRAGTTVVRVPAELADMVACPAGCATATVAGAVRVAGGCRDQVVLVLGAGALGLTCCAWAREQGAAQVIACDVRPEQLEQARRFGATRTVLATEGVAQTVRAATGERGADLVFEMCGSPRALEQGIEALRIGGTAIVVGAVFPAEPVRLSAEMIVRRMLTIRGVHNYAPEDLSVAVQFLVQAQARYPFGELVGAEHRLEEAEAAFALAATMPGRRLAVRPR